METWLLGQDDIERLLTVVGRDTLMRMVIDRLRDGLAELGRGERSNSPARTGFTRAGLVPGVIETMPHREAGGSVTVKTIAYSPDNARRFRLPTILGTIARIDDDSGRLTALSDGVLLTAIRTGAASAVASQLLARPDARVVGIVGAGAQAVTQLHGLGLLFDLDEVLVHDRDPVHQQTFAARVEFLGLPVRPVSREHLLAGSDIICTATSVGVGAGPVVPDGPHRQHLHINAIGADEVGKTELPTSLLRRAYVCVDHYEQARREGECQQLTEADIGPTLGYLCAHPDEAEPRRDSLTVFDSTGFALEDHLAFDVFLAIADELGLGSKIPIEFHPEDMLDPYSLRGLHRPGGPELVARKNLR